MSSVCIYSHYDKAGTLNEDDHSYVLDLCLNYDKVVFISSNKETSEELPDNVEFVLNAPNYGIDFGKFEYYLRNHDLSTYKTYSFTNNSCLLVRSLKPSLEHMGRKKLDFWGYTTSLEKSFHIQSYFMTFSHDCFLDFKKLLFEVAPQTNKMGYQESVDKIEIKLSKHLYKKGHKIGSYLHTHKLFGASNPVLFHVDKLLVLSKDFPFVKKKSYTDFKPITNYEREYLMSLI